MIFFFSSQTKLYTLREKLTKKRHHKAIPRTPYKIGQPMSQTIHKKTKKIIKGVV